MKLGLFGGTFNPVHYGHLINAQIVKDTFSLGKVLFIPSKYPVHKELEGDITSEDRFNMVSLAIENNPSFDVSRLEIDREDESYFIITVRQLLDIYPGDELFLIIGIDAFNDVHKWKDYKEILRKVAPIVMRRPGFREVDKTIVKLTKRIEFIDNPVIEISSSMIRENIRKNRSIKYLVPEKVGQYIINKELYKI